MLMHICLSENLQNTSFTILEHCGFDFKNLKCYQRTADLKGTLSTHHTRQAMHCILQIKSASQKPIRDTDAFF